MHINGVAELLLDPNLNLYIYVMLIMIIIPSVALLSFTDPLFHTTLLQRRSSHKERLCSRFITLRTGLGSDEFEIEVVPEEGIRKSTVVEYAKLAC